MRTWMWVFAFVSVVFSSTNVWAGEDDSFANYEQIVNELSAAANDVPVNTQAEWDDVAMQGGMSLVTSYINLNYEMQGVGSVQGSGLMTGFEGHIGSNLYSRSIRSEFAARVFIPKEVSGFDQVNMKDLEGRIVFLPRLANRLTMRMGVGLGMRFVDVEGRIPNASFAKSTSSFGTDVFAGFEKKLSGNVAVGPDVAYRASMNGDSLDKSSWDAAIRLNATF